MRRFHDTGIIKKIQILGEKIEIRVNSDGVFSATVYTDHHRSDTLAGLLPKLRRSAQKRRVKVAIPATLTGINLYEGHGAYRKFAGVGCVDVVLTGINPSTNEVQYVRADGEKGSTARFNHREIQICKPMPVVEQKRFRTLYDAKRKAEAALSEFEEHWRMEAYNAVKEAMDAAVDDPKEPETDDTDDPRLR